MFSSLWSSLQEFKQAALTAEMVPFLSSGCHLVQKDLAHSAVAIFLEAVCHCRPPIPIHPSVIMVYLYNIESFKNLVIEKPSLFPSMSEILCDRDKVEGFLQS